VVNLLPLVARRRKRNTEEEKNAIEGEREKQNIGQRSTQT